MIEVFDNFLPKYYFKDLQEHFVTSKHSDCQWFYGDNISGDEFNADLESFGFSISLFDIQTGPVYNSSGFISRVLPLIAQEKVEDLTGQEHLLVRTRAVMTVYCPESYQHERHVDMEEENITCIFYLNTSDGNTSIYDRNGTTLLKEIEPIENRLVVFDGKYLHAGHSPSKNKNRVLINMNFVTPQTMNYLL